MKKNKQPDLPALIKQAAYDVAKATFVLHECQVKLDSLLKQIAQGDLEQMVINAYTLGLIIHPTLEPIEPKK